jgi:hypothetical protein
VGIKTGAPFFAVLEGQLHKRDKKKDHFLVLCCNAPARRFLGFFE